MDMRPPIVYSVEACSSRRNGCAMHRIDHAAYAAFTPTLLRIHCAVTCCFGNQRRRYDLCSLSVCLQSAIWHGARGECEIHAHTHVQSIPLRQSCGATRKDRMRIVGNVFSCLRHHREFSFCILAINWRTCCHVLACTRFIFSFSSASAGASTSSVIDAATRERERAPCALVCGLIQCVSLCFVMSRCLLWMQSVQSG